jgi:putative ABC transport system permease protein
VAIVSEDAARLFWPGGDAIGERATMVAPDAPNTPVQIVGIVANVRKGDIDQRVVPQVYVPSTWKPDRTMAVVVRADSTDPLQLVPAIRAQAAAIDPGEPLFNVASMQQVLYEDLASTYTLAGLLGAIAIVALCLAGVGIYGVVSFMVTQRTREIGLRMALGARPGVVLGMVIQQAARPVAGGGMLGAPAALGLVYVASSTFAEIDATDPVHYVGVTLSILLVALAASYVPARRAARIDPLMALRQD